MGGGGSLSSQPWAHVTETRFAAVSFLNLFLILCSICWACSIILLSNRIRRRTCVGTGIHEESRNKEVVAKTRNRQSKKGFDNEHSGGWKFYIETTKICVYSSFIGFFGSYLIEEVVWMETVRITKRLWHFSIVCPSYLYIQRLLAILVVTGLGLSVVISLEWWSTGDDK